MEEVNDKVVTEYVSEHYALIILADRLSARMKILQKNCPEIAKKVMNEVAKFAPTYADIHRRG